MFSRRMLRSIMRNAYGKNRTIEDSEAKKRLSKIVYSALWLKGSASADQGLESLL